MRSTLKRTRRRAPAVRDARDADDAIDASVVKALANDRRLEIMRWLKEPTAHFAPQVDGDLVKDGVCGLYIAGKLGVSQPTASEHLRILVAAGLIRGTRIKSWTFYKRDERRIADVKRAFRKAW
jgi:DNA-binding transcriptional ArsR family regulator